MAATPTTGPRARVANAPSQPKHAWSGGTELAIERLAPLIRVGVGVEARGHDRTRSRIRVEEETEDPSEKDRHHGQREER